MVPTHRQMITEINWISYVCQYVYPFDAIDLNLCTKWLSTLKGTAKTMRKTNAAESSARKKAIANAKGYCDVLCLREMQRVKREQCGRKQRWKKEAIAKAEGYCVTRCVFEICNAVKEQCGRKQRWKRNCRCERVW